MCIRDRDSAYVIIKAAGHLPMLSDVQLYASANKSSDELLSKHGRFYELIPYGFVKPALNNIGFVVESYNTCLLYTSPSPRDRTRYRMPSSA